MNTEKISAALAGNVGMFLICAIGGLAGGALAYPILVSTPAPVAKAAEVTDVMLRAVPDPARGVTCYVSSLGGVSCVPDQWFTPPPAAELKPQATPAPSRGWDL